MKKTRPSNKQTPVPKQRRRRTNLELAGFGREHLRTIRQISEQSRVPIDQVLADVIENGLITVMPIYDSMIEFRKSRATRLTNLFNRNEPINSEPTGQGSTEEQPELVTGGTDTGKDAAALDRDTASLSPRDFDGFADADVQPGLEGALDSYPGASHTNGEVEPGD